VDVKVIVAAALEAVRDATRKIPMDGETFIAIGDAIDRVAGVSAATTLNGMLLAARAEAIEACAKRCEWFARAVSVQEGHDLEVWSAKRCAEEIRTPDGGTKLVPPGNLVANERELCARECEARAVSEDKLVQVSGWSKSGRIAAEAAAASARGCAHDIRARGGKP
jgi:hypothetical protein